MATALKGTIWGGVTFSATPATVSIPTGSINLPSSYNQTIDFTVPTGIKVVALYQTLDLSGQVTDNSRHTISTFYIGVTPGSSHKLTNFFQGNPNTMAGTHFGVKCGTHNNAWVGEGVPPLVFVVSVKYRISWSPEINTHTPDHTDY